MRIATVALLLAITGGLLARWIPSEGNCCPMEGASCPMRAGSTVNCELSGACPAGDAVAPAVALPGILPPRPPTLTLDCSGDSGSTLAVFPSSVDLPAATPPPRG